MPKQRTVGKVGRWADPDVIAAAVRGRSAADALIAQIWPACFRLAATLTGDSALAQDAAQEACVQVYRKVRGLRNIDAFDAWIYRIVVREALRVRGKRSTEAVYEQSVFPHDGVSVDVWRALESLSPEQRAVCVLYYFDDFTTAEIAGILRAPHATVRTRLARARERLAGLLEDYAGDFRPVTEVRNAC